ncbi:hypothetical protein [Dyella dinghuensis]|nr:hypothetical protein [Dyella dinghuensis]
MNVAMKRALWLGIGLCLPWGLATSVAAADNTGWIAAPPSQDIMPDADWVTLFDQSKPLADRQHMLANLEQSPGLKDDPEDLYRLGSLYHMGEHAPGSPVQEDPVKATLYLGNAALHGSTLAMAKMAELKLAAGQYREAMNWAQIYSHYALMSPASQGTATESYAAELVDRIKDKIDQSVMPAVMADVNSFVAQHDADIRLGMAREQAREHHTPKTPKHYYVGPLGSRASDSGIADYMLVFNADGTVATMLLIDAVPRPNIGTTMRSYAASMTLKPQDNQRPRYAWVPVLLGNHEYRMDSAHGG